ncbi:protein GOLVEN 6-like [Salvia miltiorrhiza]|uniref:protein GOLVEN 6-like n=1 Tax=Salvia miltiorrhiza TaxID=226208 RepID=UPI0025AD1317|nr:protein GOLVEN 6-like [Salvia miltiorrhiza]
MELWNLVTALCVALSFMLASCASDHVNLQQHYGIGQQPQLSLPRKLKQLLQVKSSSYKDIMLQKKLLEGTAGEKKIEKEEDVMRGTWREWVERPNKSEYFTMDYSWVRRRRPIHNKQIPFVP